LSAPVPPLSFALQTASKEPARRRTQAKPRYPAPRPGCAPARPRPFV
jgi:hypothetical protein